MSRAMIDDPDLALLTSGVRCRKLSRFYVALRDKTAVRRPECPILPMQKCLAECVSILCHFGSRA